MEAEDRGGDGITAPPIDGLDGCGLIPAPAMVSSGVEAAVSVDDEGGCGRSDNPASDGACELAAASEMVSGGGEVEAAVNDIGSGESSGNHGGNHCGVVTGMEMISSGGEAAAGVEDGVGAASSENCDGDRATEKLVDRVNCCGMVAAGLVISDGGGAAGVDASSENQGHGAVDRVDGCELMAAAAMISNSRDTETAVDDGDGCGSSENCSGDGATAEPADQVDGCSGEVEAAVDDGGGISENRVGNGAIAATIDWVGGSGLVTATAMISGGGEAEAALRDGGGSGRSENHGDAAIAAPMDWVNGCGLVTAPAMISSCEKAEATADDGGSSGRKKRGRPQRGQVRALAAKKVKVVVEEEDVCFICFDGGSLVLCDRRGCPKAYHPACVKRDEAFFQSKAKWNCGWHICSICQKAAHHMCYTCTYSLCKTCIKAADYLSIRENKGLCATCMRTVMLIEQEIPGNKDMVQVDFDDKSSWEYLFKVYWVYLKEKLSLSLDELIQAKTPHKAAESIVCKEQPLDIVCGSADCKSSISNVPSRHLEVTDSKKRRIKEKHNLPNIKDGRSRGKSSSEKNITLSGSPEWATKELLEFVAHMRNGDISVLSQFDIQSLLLEYIKRNNLRDPRRKSQIICDSRLMNLFFKPRVGHFEMLKLLEYHFLIKEDNQKENTLGTIGHSVPIQVEGGGNNESLLMIDKDKKRKTRRKGEEKGPQTNLDEFAAIDVHNINLIYLRRSLMENLVTTNGKFHGKVVGSIVRIRISGGDPKQDMYRLVQVIGTCKASVPYKVGGKTVDLMLIILNLHKKETVAIDSISNQEFSEDECRRLRQSIKCGLVKRMTVGQVQEKARSLQEVRLNDWLETEMLRLNHLRDRASEKGRKKELRECVEKIELLKTPEERHRRLNENLQVHADPKMDPKCESDDDAGEVSKQKQVDQVEPRLSGFRKLGGDLISTKSKNKQAKFNSDEGPSSRFREKVCELPKRKETVVLQTPTVSPLHKREGTVVSETPIVSLSNGSIPSACKSETEKLWQYRDPKGKIQGPFCLVQLRKWSTTGYFPLDMRVWSITTDEGDSLLLTDVLNGNFHKALPSRSNTPLPDRLYICEDRHSSSVNPTLVNDSKHSNGSWNCASATSFHQVTVHEDRRWISGTTNRNLSSHVNTSYPHAGHEIQSDSQHFPGQSSVGSWRPLAVNIASTDSNFSLASVAKSVDSSGPHKISVINVLSPSLVTADSRDLKNDTSKDQKSSQSCALVQDLVMEELPSPTPKVSDRDEKADLGIPNFSYPSMAVDTDEKVDSSFGNSPNSLPNARAGDEQVQAIESKPVGSNWIYGSSTPTRSDINEKTDLFAQNLQNPSPRTVDGGKIVNSSIQNSLRSAPDPRDRDKKLEPHDSKPPFTSLICDAMASKPSDGDEKADVGIQNLLSLSSETVDGDGKVNSSFQNLPSSPLDPSDGNEKVQANVGKPSSTSLDFTSTLANPNDRDEKVNNLSSPSPKTVDEDENVGSTIRNFLSLPPDIGDGNEIIQTNGSKSPVAGLTCTANPPKLSDTDEKAGVDLQNLPNASHRNVDEDVKIYSTVQNLPSSLPDPASGNKIDGANKNEPPVTGLTCTSSPPEPSDRDEEAVIDIKNLPSISSQTGDVDVKVDSTVQNLPNSLPDPACGNEIDPAYENKPRGTSLTCSSSPPEPNDRDEKAGKGIQNLPSLLPDMVDGEGEVDLPVRSLLSSLLDPKDGNENVQANKIKLPGTTSIRVSSTAELNERDEEANAGVQNLPSPLPKTVDGDERIDLSPNITNKNDKVEATKSKLLNDGWTSNSSGVDGGGSQLDRVTDEWKSVYSSTRTKPPEMSCDQFATPASISDQFSAPSTFDYSPSTSNWRALAYEPIELSTLAEESVSDLLAEVDAMEAQGDATSPTSAMYSGDDFFEDSKGDYFASIRGMGHLFDFDKTDDLSSTEESSSLPRPTIVSEPFYPTQYDIFNSTKRSNGETSTSCALRVGTQYHHNIGIRAENGINNHISFETRPMGSNWGNTNRNFGGLTQGTTFMGWRSNPGLAQVNMDMNRNTTFGFMGHERCGNWRDDGDGSSNFSRSQPEGQRVCKSCESGCCPKGAACRYL